MIVNNGYLCHVTIKLEFHVPENWFLATQIFLNL